ncbi:MAG: hypothetical protein EBY24_03805 [Betaproteobacteria bacterium]|nr:hypothetical protein [Betaproteobacteria bacterium]
MPSLALTDALLAAVALWIGFNRQLPVALRLAGAIFSAAAVLGVLRFSGVYPLPTWHQFASMLAAVCAFPLLAVAVVFPDALATRTTRFAWIFMCLMAVLGVLVVAAGQKRLLADALALVSVLAMLLTLARLGHWSGAAGVALMLLGLLAFALKPPLAEVLQPGDWLHIGMAAGLLQLARMDLWPALRSTPQQLSDPRPT